MRIIHVITSLFTGGAEKLMVDLLPLLQSKGHEVELVLFDGTNTPFFEALKPTGLKIHSLGKGDSVYNPKFIWKLRKILETTDIVHTHNTSPQLFTAISSKLFLKRKPILITTEHNTSNRRRTIPFFKWIDQWMYNQYSQIICISNQAAINLNGYLKNLESKVIVVYNGVDLSKYRLPSSIQKVTRNQIVVTMVAAFRKQKDQSTLIRAMSLLPEKYELQLVGTGDTEIIKKCQSLVADLDLTKRVRFLGMRTDVPTILNQSDIIVLSSHYEGLSLSSIEGLTSGKPFLASNVDGLREVVNGFGVLFEHENERDLAQKIIDISTNPTWANQIIEKCLKRASQFDIKTMAFNYILIYNKIMLDH